MDKKAFIEVLAQRTGLSIRDARLALNTCLNLIVTLNSRRERVIFDGFGTFEIHYCKDVHSQKALKEGDKFVPIFLPDDTSASFS